MIVEGPTLNLEIKYSYTFSRFWLYLAVFICLSPMHVSAIGYVDKDHYLYPIMIDIRYHKYDEAMAKLEPYAEKGDAEALFWYGYMKQSNWGRDRFSAYRWYEKSIAGGSPYSMFKLSGEDGTDYVDNWGQSKFIGHIFLM